MYLFNSFINSRTRKILDTATLRIKFDQPLWLNAVEITKSKSMNIVRRSGGLHLLMSFLGSI